ncbi:MAG: TMEM165/GDT1 family protein [Actinobacteria bacterium]|nr:TMEM165/GDT1 family protein [Actinomycetota bacterium]
MWWKALLASFGLIFVAELGDKTQLAILTLSAKYGFRQVFMGAAAAFALLNALAVSVGVALYELVPEKAIKYAVSAAFILFGLFMLLPERKKEGKGTAVPEADGDLIPQSRADLEGDREGNDAGAPGGRDEDNERSPRLPAGAVIAKHARGPFLSAFLMVGLMELGDKTQLSLLALAAKYSYPALVFAGGTLALWATSLIGALVGAGLGRVIPQAWMRRISGVIFIAFGIINLF